VAAFRKTLAAIEQENLGMRLASDPEAAKRGDYMACVVKIMQIAYSDKAQPWYSLWCCAVCGLPHFPALEKVHVLRRLQESEETAKHQWRADLPELQCRVDRKHCTVCPP
jgi:hypothetical protein